MNRLTLASSFLALIAVAHIAQAEQPLPRSERSSLTLTIRTYAPGAGDMPPASTLQLATALLADAGLLPRWVHCGLTGAEDACLRPIGPGELAIRFIRDPGGTHHRTMALGDSLVDTGRRTGVLATVYLDRVDELARGAGGNVEVILARVIAHETAHLVLGTGAHGSSGLMRPLWSAAMLRDEPEGAWVFTPDEGQRMQDAVASLHAHDGSPGRGLHTFR